MFIKPLSINPLILFFCPEERRSKALYVPSNQKVKNNASEISILFGAAEVFAGMVLSMTDPEPVEGECLDKQKKSQRMTKSRWDFGSP